jgi:hypothetical protein
MHPSSIQNRAQFRTHSEFLDYHRIEQSTIPTWHVVSSNLPLGRSSLNCGMSGRSCILDRGSNLQGGNLGWQVFSGERVWCFILRCSWEIDGPWLRHTTRAGRTTTWRTSGEAGIGGWLTRLLQGPVRWDWRWWQLTVNKLEHFKTISVWKFHDVEEELQRAGFFSSLD